MNESLIVYDNAGVLLIIKGPSEPVAREPLGVPFLWVNIPQGKQVIGVDVTVTPHQVILEDLPLSEIELLRVDQARANAELVQLIMLMIGGKHL